MSKRNEDRLPQKEQEVQQQDTAPIKSLKELNWITPVEIVELPSKGKFYTKESSLYGVRELELKHMTAHEEDILTNRSYIKRGVAIDKVLQSVLVDKNIKVSDLLVGDKNALLISLRSTAYGNMYKTSIICPECAESFTHEFDLELIENNEGELSKFNAKLTDNNTVLLTLPKTKSLNVEINVEIRPLNGHDETWLIKKSEVNKKHKLPDRVLSEQLKRFIVSINGEKDRELLEQFVNNMPALYSRWLRTAYNTCLPNVDLQYKVECPTCEENKEVRMPLTAEFFFPSS